MIAGLAGVCAALNEPVAVAVDEGIISHPVPAARPTWPAAQIPGAPPPEHDVTQIGAVTGRVADVVADVVIKPSDVVSIPPAREKMYEALFNVQDKLYLEAIPKLEWVIREDPTLLDAWEALGWSYYNVGEKDKAHALWERLLRLAPNQPMPYNCLAQLATGASELDRAGALFKKSLELAPDQYEIRFAYAQNLLWRGFLDESVERLNQLIKEDSDRLDIRLELARAMFANQQFEESLAHWAVIRKVVPDNIEYLVAEAEALLYIGDLEVAAERAEQALEQDENNAKALTILADIAEFSRRPEDAVPELRKIADLVEDQGLKSKILRRLAWRLRQLYIADPAQWPLAGAMDVCREAIDCDPLSVDLRLFLGELLVMDRRFAEAERVFNKVLDDFNPHNLRAKKGLLEIMFAQDRLDDAERQIKQINTLFNPEDPYRFLDQARLEFARGDFFAALQSLDRFEELGARGAVLVLLYHSLSPSEWIPMTSVRRFREHLLALQRAGFTFVTPDEIPGLFEKMLKNPPTNEIKPGLYRMWRNIKYAFTGTDKLTGPSLREYTPEKYVCVTFDDALRSTFVHGTPIADELGVRFAVHVPVGNVLAHEIGIASWEEMRRYDKTGSWVFGSHLLDAHFEQPINADGYLAYPLCNRVWNPERNRPETLRSYFTRLRREFKESRAIIIKELGLDQDEVSFVAYPYGDIGQEDRCNLADVRNPVEVILNEAHMNYKIGFIQSQFGFGVNGDNHMILQRHEPDKYAGGRDVLNHAFKNHPVFMARRMRAEIAALQGKLYLAQQMLDELERDGYPDELQKELAEYVQQHLARRVEAPKIKDVNRQTQGLIRFSNPYVGVEADSTRANVQLEQWKVLGKAGLNVTPAVTIEGRAAFGRIKQTITTNIWKEVQVVKETTTRRRSVSVVDGQTTVTESEETTWDPQTIQTNTVRTDTYRTDETDLALQANYRFRNGSLFLGEFTGRSFSGDISNQTEYCWAAEYQWKPSLALDASARYEHDVIPSAQRLITYHSGALFGSWRACDWWDLVGRGRFAYLSDNNSLFNLNAESSWLVSERQGLYLGLQGYFITTDKDNIYYWTPYWEQRYYLFVKIQRSYPGVYADVQVRAGQMTAKAREEEEQSYKTRKVQAEREGWWPGDDPNRGWEPIVGASATLRQQFGAHWEFYGTFSVDILRDYTEHNLQGGLILHF